MLETFKAKVLTFCRKLNPSKWLVAFFKNSFIKIKHQTVNLYNYFYLHYQTATSSIKQFIGRIFTKLGLLSKITVFSAKYYKKIMALKISKLHIALIILVLFLLTLVLGYFNSILCLFAQTYPKWRYFFFCYYYTIPVITIFIFFFNISISLQKNVSSFSIQFQRENLIKNFYRWFYTNLFCTVMHFFMTFAIQSRHAALNTYPDFAAALELTTATTEYNLFTQHATFNILGASIVLLVYLIGLSCLYYLAEHNLLEKSGFVFYFMFFIICTTILVTTENFLVLVLAFEFLFFPSLVFAYKSGYAGKSIKSVIYLVIWTLLGSFLILSLTCYLYMTCGSLDYMTLRAFKFSDWELTCIYTVLFIGFGIKIPVFPAHYWLTKVHVEAAGGFSMFLSGFLVKTALYGFYTMHLVFTTIQLNYIIIVLACIGILEASFKMWVQVDLKKLIAYATIQEMNLLLLALLLFQTSNLGIIAVFTLMHGTLSALLFFLVDIINKRVKSRNIHALSGLSVLYPQLNVVIWGALLNFFGFPFTVKFFLEWSLASLLLSYFGPVATIFFIFVLFIGNISFAKAWFSILYGLPSSNLKTLQVVTDLTGPEKKTSIFLLSLLFIYIFLLFFL